MLRYIVRPTNIRKTPRIIADALSVRTRTVDARHTCFDLSSDFFCAYPPAHRVVDGNGVPCVGDSCYESLRGFYTSSKPTQRLVLARSGIRTPWTRTSHTDWCNHGTTVPRYIVRPFAHSGGRNYRITEDQNDFREGQEYLQAVFPKDREYRIIFIYGEPIIWYRKKVTQGTPAEVAWNHDTGSFFLTIQRPETCKLTETTAIEDLLRSPIIQNASIVAADIMWHPTLGYSVCELNMCPGIQIPASIERIVSYVQHHFN